MTATVLADAIFNEGLGAVVADVNLAALEPGRQKVTPVVDQIHVEP